MPLLALAALTTLASVLPVPRNVAPTDCEQRFETSALSLNTDIDRGAQDILYRRFFPLGIPLPIRGPGEGDIHVVIDPKLGPQNYRLIIRSQGAIAISAGDTDGVFYGVTTLAQLARPAYDGWTLACGDISDGPSLRLRVLSDDVSRGPLPNFEYFLTRIATAAAYKMNGYSPYLEDVYNDRTFPLAAQIGGITSRELHLLAVYAESLHVAFIPEQQSFAHLHGVGRFELYDDLFETPHGSLLSPTRPEGDAIIAEIMRDELGEIPHPSYMHIGTDEPFDLGRGMSSALVAREGRAGAISDHVHRLLPTIEAAHARALMWDDAAQADPGLFTLLPHSIALVAWHYDDTTSDLAALQKTKAAGFDQLVAPGASNWNQFFPDLPHAFANADRMIADGKSVGALGLFETVWHDDGETLFEDTWAPVIESSAAAWQAKPLRYTEFLRVFAASYLLDTSYADDFDRLSRAREMVKAAGDPDDYLFWLDPFDDAARSRVEHAIDLVALRKLVEPVIEHLEHPRGEGEVSVHPALVRAMLLAAKRYDVLARRFQIADESAARYRRASNLAAHAPAADANVERELFAARYLSWEERDELLELARLTTSAFSYENVPQREGAIQAKYRLAIQRSVARSEAIEYAIREGYVHDHRLPPYERIQNAR